MAVATADRHFYFDYERKIRVGAENILISAVAAAAIVVSGAAYALFFALGRLHRSASANLAAAVAYVALTIATMVLVVRLGLHGAWLWIAAVMLIGYLLAPYAIWNLTVETHAGGAIDTGRASSIGRH